jgi:hypothetical protein
MREKDRINEKNFKPESLQSCWGLAKGSSIIDNHRGEEFQQHVGVQGGRVELGGCTEKREKRLKQIRLDVADRGLAPGPPQRQLTQTALRPGSPQTSHTTNLAMLPTHY